MKPVAKLIPLLVAPFSLAVNLLFYPRLPDLMASHWGISGRVDGYVTKTTGILILPLTSLVLYLLFIFLPRFDPIHPNFPKFKKYYIGFVNVILIFLFYLNILVIAWNLGYRFDITRLLMPALATIFFFAGVLIGKAQRNWFVGIRTPWTLSSDTVWQKTHALGKNLFKLSALLTLLGAIFPRLAFVLVFFPIIFSSVFLFVYSCYLFQKQAKVK